MSSSKNPIRIDKRKSMHLSQALLLEETGVPRLVRRVIVTLTAVIGAFIAWSMITSIDEVAISSGKVIPSGRIKRIQSEDGGIISAILVDEGQGVYKGQDLIILDSSVSVANLDQHLVKQATLNIRKERLGALIEGRTPNFDEIPERYEGIVQKQRHLHLQTVETLEVSRAILDNQIQQYEAELSELANREKTLKKQYALMRDEYRTYEDLFKRELVGKIEFFGIKRQFLQIQEYLNQIPVRRIQVREKLTESKNRLVKLHEDSMKNWMDEIATVESELAETEQIVKRFKRDVVQRSIKAGENGIVHNIQVNSPGEIIKPGETILELVPMGRNLVAEVRISSRDVGHVEEGQKATVKFTAFDYARYGGIEGKLSSISPTSIVLPDGSVYYEGIITLEENHLVRGSNKLLVLPGMTVQADIKTGEKTLLGYFMKPIYLSLTQAFRER